MQAEHSPIATKADVQRQTRLIVMWIVGAQIAFAVIMIALFGILFATAAGSPAPQPILT